MKVRKPYQKNMTPSQKPAQVEPKEVFLKLLHEITEESDKSSAYDIKQSMRQTFITCFENVPLQTTFYHFHTLLEYALTGAGLCLNMPSTPMKTSSHSLLTPDGPFDLRANFTKYIGWAFSFDESNHVAEPLNDHHHLQMQKTVAELTVRNYLKTVDEISKNYCQNNGSTQRYKTDQEIDQDIKTLYSCIGALRARIYDQYKLHESYSLSTRDSIPQLEESPS